MIVCDNFLDRISLTNLQTWIFDENFIWVYASPITLPNTQTRYQFCFVNSLYHNREFYDNDSKMNHLNYDSFFINQRLKPLLSQLYIRCLLRVRVCAYTKTKEPEFHGYHYDFEDYIPNTKEIFTRKQAEENKTNDLHPAEEMKIAIFYLNTNNGQTCLDGDRIDSIENRLVCFSNNVQHQSISQTDCDRRITININYF